MEKSLGSFVDENKAKLLKEKCKSLEGCAVVAGRTDKGVSAFQQRNDVKPVEIEDAINSAVPGKFRVISISQVSRVFHPNFSTKWRRYLYIFPLSGGENREQGSDSDSDSCIKVENFCSNESVGELYNGCGENIENLLVNDEGVLESDEMSTNTSHRRCNGFMDFSFTILWLSYFQGPTKKMIPTLVIIPAHKEDDSFGGATLTLILQAFFFFIFFFKIAL